MSGAPTAHTGPGLPRPGEPLPHELLDEGERLTCVELRELQLVRLRATLRHAYENVELYRRKFDGAGVKPEDCRSLEDLARFPFTTKADLRDTYPFGMFAVPMSEVRRVHASSGTTGRPTVVGYTESDLSMWADVMARSIRAAGGRPGHKVHVSYGYGLFTGGLGAHYGAERAGCTVIPVSGGMTTRQVQIIRDFTPEIILRGVNVFPTQIEEIVLRTPDVAPHFQIQLTRPGRMDHMTVHVEARRGAGPEQRESAATSIARGIKDGVGITAEVAVVDPETLERSVGKLHRVKDLRQP